jgi:hypothetical protein
VWFTINNQSDKEIFLLLYTLYPDTSANIGYVSPGKTITPGPTLGPGQEYTKGAPRHFARILLLDPFTQAGDLHL